MALASAFVGRKLFVSVTPDGGDVGVLNGGSGSKLNRAIEPQCETTGVTAGNDAATTPLATMSVASTSGSTSSGYC